MIGPNVIACCRRLVELYDEREDTPELEPLQIIFARAFVADAILAETHPLIADTFQDSGGDLDVHSKHEWDDAPSDVQGEPGDELREAVAWIDAQEQLVAMVMNHADGPGSFEDMEGEARELIREILTTLASKPPEGAPREPDGGGR